MVLDRSNYEAVDASGAVVRAGFAMDSALAGTLMVGDVVSGLETKVNAKGVTRVRFTSEQLKGWASMHAGDGTTLLAKTKAVPAKAAAATPARAKYKVVDNGGVVIRAGFDMASKLVGSLKCASPSLHLCPALAPLCLSTS